jgi:multicomponent Na+:H+ antiporter subunit F
MTTFCLWAAGLLLLSIAVGLIRIVRGPTPADRLMAAQLFGTAGTAILFLLAHAQKLEALQDVALVFGLLAAVTSVAFAQRLWPNDGGGAR